MMTGTTKDSRVVSLQCSGVAPCTNIALQNIHLNLSNGTEAGKCLCGNVQNTIGWNYTGAACVGGSATGRC